MTIVLLLLFIFSLIFLLKSFANKFAWFFTLMIWALSGAIFANLLLIAKTGNYMPIPLFKQWDYNFFLAIANIKIPYYSIIWVYNISIAIYLFALPLFTFFYFNNRHFTFSTKSKLAVFVLMIFPVFYLWFYNPKVSLWLYANVYSVTSAANTLKFTFNCIDLLNYFIIYIYMFAPFIFVFRSHKRINMPLMKKQAIGATLCLIMLNFICISIFAMSSFRHVYFKGNAANLINFGAKQVYLSLYVIMPALIFISVIIMFYATTKFNMTKNIGIVNQWIMKRNVTTMNRNLINTFHSFKNIVFSYKLLVKKAMQEEGEQQKTTLNLLRDEMNNYIKHLSKMLSVNDRVDIETENHKIESILDEALKRVYNLDGIKVEREYASSDTIVMVDSLYMTDAFANIIQNAVDSINSSRSGGTMRIEVFTEFEWVLVKIIDDGVGVSRKELRSIFKPFYTTKSRITNWGIGLAFVFRIIKLHMGYISVQSRVGKGTTFSVMLPRTK